MSVLRRTFDIALATLGLVIGSPLLGLVALAVWIDSPGPAIFAQERLGRRGRRFRMYKYRKFPALMKGGASVTVAGDARMTWVGAVIERTKLDELPQLWNVLKGDMSFVGPRPESPAYADLFEGEYAKLLDYTPGVFGPSQVHFRNESELYPPGDDPEKFYREYLFTKKADLDLEYFARSNILTDIAWIARGLWVSAAGVVDWWRFVREHALLVMGDVLLIEAAWTAAHLIRYGGLPEREMSSYLWGLAVFPSAIVGGMLGAGLYRRIIRHFSLSDAVSLAKIVSVSWMLGVTLLMGFIVRSSSALVAVLGWALTLNLLFIPRLYVRYREATAGGAKHAGAKKIVIYGVNDLGAALAQWASLEKSGFKMAGFLDDSSSLRNRMVSGHSALGGLGDIRTVHAAVGMDELWLVAPINAERLSWLAGTCDDIGVSLVDFMEMYPFAQAAMKTALVVEGPGIEKTATTV
ncbi:MAG: sugar transferase [Nitrospinae bacterium]|nr:sugar transferase [Nitrospinota bacterium]